MSIKELLVAVSLGLAVVGCGTSPSGYSDNTATSFGSLGGCRYSKKCVEHHYRYSISYIGVSDREREKPPQSMLDQSTKRFQAECTSSDGSWEPGCPVVWETTPVAYCISKPTISSLPLEVRALTTFIEPYDQTHSSLECSNKNGIFSVDQPTYGSRLFDN